MLEILYFIYIFQKNLKKSFIPFCDMKTELFHLSPVQ